MNNLFSCQYGSRLYGTSTPTSDTDWKHIVLPDLNKLLIGSGVKNVDKKTNSAKNTRNTEEDIDETFIPIQVFAKDFYMGQTYALELAYAIDGDHAGQKIHIQPTDTKNQWFSSTGDIKHQMFYQFARELRDKFLTSNIKAMMGYAVNQASLYSFKGERLNVAREFLEILERVEQRPLHSTVQLGDIVERDPGVWQSMANLGAKYPKYFRQTEYDIGGERMRPCFILLEKTLPWTNEVHHTIGIVENLVNKYGARADAASADNVDWKATMHALRIVDEGLRLLSGQGLKFPLPKSEVDKLLSIKQGRFPLETVTAELTRKLDQLKELEQTTTLKPSSSERQEALNIWLATWMRDFYMIKDC